MNAALPRRATGVLFDMDGILLDTEVIYTKVTQAIVSDFGKTFDWSIKAGMIGRPQRESAQYLIDTLNLPITVAAYLSKRNSNIIALFKDTAALPGAQRLVEHLHQAGIPMAVATSSTEYTYSIKTQQHAWFSLFDAIITGDNPAIGKGKPAPDIFLLAAKNINVAPADCLVFEDAPSGLQAGISAGCQVVSIPDTHMDTTLYTNSTEILTSMTEFSPQKYGLPAY